MKHVWAFLKHKSSHPLDTDGGSLIKDIELLLFYGDACVVNVATPKELLAVDLWCQQRTYKLHPLHDGQVIDIDEAYRTLNTWSEDKDLADVTNIHISLQEGRK